MHYRLFPSVNGPSTPASYTGPFLAGAVFCVTQPGMWFEGYWWWVCPSGQSVAPVKCALWTHVAGGGGGGILVPGSVVTSGPLIAGQWNYIPLPTPVQLSVGSTSCSPYTAAIGVNGSFPDTTNQFGSGQPYGTGITNGPLFGYGYGTVSCPYTSEPAQVFSTANTDPALVMPQSQSLADNFWVDLQVTDVAPSVYTGTYRLWPNKGDTVSGTGADSPLNYVVATEIRLSQACSTVNVWYYSPPGTTQLATACDIWTVTGNGTTGTRVAGTTSPSWSGAAGSGWVYCPLVANLPAGTYKVSVYNGAASPVGWNAMTFGYFGVYSGNNANACGINGITSGPLYAPPTATAKMAYEFLNSAATTPPYTNGLTEPGQATFAVGPPNQYPYIYVDGLYQCYWVDLEVTASSSTQLVSGSSAAISSASCNVFVVSPPPPITSQPAPVIPVQASNSVLFMHGQMVTLRHRVVSGQDAYGNDTLAYTEVQVGPCSIQQTGSRENINFTDQILTNVMVFVPYGTNVSYLDAIILPDGTEYEVQGDPETWISPFSGHVAPIRVMGQLLKGAAP